MYPLLSPPASHRYCFAFKDENGKSIDVQVQQDSAEYLAKFLDKVEGQLKGTEQANVFKDTIMGREAR